MTVSQPNFLLISTDQQRADHLGCYGAQQLKTPHIDGLAARGTRFTRAYVASPVCMPNRASLVTGRFPSLHGVRHNGLNLPLETRTIADVLRQAGYRTSLSGKAHFQCVTNNPAQIQGDPDNTARWPEPGNYDQEQGPQWRNDPKKSLNLPYYGFDHIDLAVGHGDQVDGHYNRWVTQQGSDLEKLRGPENAQRNGDCALFQAWRTSVPEHLYPTRFIQNMTVDALARYAQDTEKPFFHWASFCDPHHPFTPPGRYWDMYTPDEIELPKSFGQCHAGNWASKVRQLRQSGKANLEGSSAVGVSDKELRQAIALTFGLIAMVDDAIGTILAELERTGLSESTIVVFLSDHGDLMGDHGMIFKGPLHYQSLLRMPLIWSDPRTETPAVRDDLVSAVDIPATILETAGLEPFHGMNGRFFKSRDGTDVVIRGAAMIEDEIQTNLPGTTIRGRVRSLVTARWRLTIFDNIKEGELFDLKNDPNETTNLWGEPTARTVRAELTDLLLREMIANSETGRLPDFAA